MPPQLALLACAVFVLALLRVERKHAPNVSFAAWIPTAWMLLVSTKPLALWFSGSASAGGFEDGSPLDRGVLLVLLVGGLAVLVRRRFRGLDSLLHHKWLLFLVGFMLVSVLWSEITFVSFKRWVRQFQAIIMALVLLSEESPQDSVRSLLRRLVYILIPASFLLIKYYPQFGVEYGQYNGQLMWVGVTTQKNGLGRLCFLSAFFLLWSIFSQRHEEKLRWSHPIILVECFLLFLIAVLLRGPEGAYSATSLVVVMIGTAIYAALWWTRSAGLLYRRLALAGVATILVLGAITPLIGGATISGLSGSLGRDTTLTGRTDIWGWLVPLAYNNLLTGVGFGGFWTPKTISVYDVNEAHNGYLDVVLETGLVGLSLHFAFLLACCRQACQALEHNFEWGAFCLSLICMTAMYNYTESTMNLLATQVTATLLFSILCLTHQESPAVVSDGIDDLQVPSGAEDQLTSPAGGT
jgi:O-antigen ligase